MTNRIKIISLALIAGIAAWPCQTSPTSPDEELEKKTMQQPTTSEVEAEEDNEIYNVATVEQKPQFPGGEQAMYTWLATNLMYPPAALAEGVQGRIIVRVLVDKDGSIKDVKVMKGRHRALDKEAIRVVSSMPNWEPGRNNGQPVKVTYLLPVIFKLAKPKKEKN